MILLMGAEVAFSTQNAGTYARERLAVTPSARARLCLAYGLMKKIKTSFAEGKGPFDTIDYGVTHSIPVRLVNDVIDILARNGLVAEAADHPGCYTLLRDPADIHARAITDAILNEGADPGDLGMSDDFPMFGKITDESFQSLEKQVLKNF
jgi:membrane protein